MNAARAIGLVTQRELREGVRGRRFLVSTVVVLLLLGGVAAASLLFGGRDSVSIGLGGSAPPRLARGLDRAAQPYDVDVKLHRYATAAAAREAVAHRKVDAAFVAGGRRLLVREGGDATATAVAGAAARSAFLSEWARRVGVTPAQARAVLAPPVAVAQVPAEVGSGDSQGLALGATILLFLAVSIYGQSVLTSVIQEKSSRIVEVLLATLRPRHLLAGKVVGVGLLGLVQVALVVVVAVVAGRAGAFSLPSAGRALPLVVVWFLLGYAFYAVAYAAAGSLVSRVEDASGVVLPVTLTMTACYIASFGQISNPDGGLAIVLTLLPPAAPFAVPARAALTAIPAWQYVLSFALTLLAIWLLVRAAGRIYELGVLRTGPRVPFREAFQAARRASA